ncbi:MAG: hypothetical protein KF694_24625 [Mesorhizobium sp.]|nr:hypothetical protein [Mesorhizobium sp.]
MTAFHLPAANGSRLASGRREDAARGCVVAKHTAHPSRSPSIVMPAAEGQPVSILLSGYTPKTPARSME